MLWLLQLLCVGNKSVSSVGKENYFKFFQCSLGFPKCPSFLQLIFKAYRLVKKGSFTPSLIALTNKNESVLVNCLVFQEHTNDSKHFVAILCCSSMSPFGCNGCNTQRVV